MGDPIPRERGLSNRMRALIAVAVLFVLIVAAGAYVTSSPTICSTCHEMRPAVLTWETSAHTKVGCNSCHTAPRPWYEFPAKLVEQTSNLAHDTSVHFSSDKATHGPRSLDSSVTIPDSVCLGCHDPAREITMRFGTLIDHKEHSARNKSCISCHWWTAHPAKDADQPLLLMGRCFTCHGRSASAKAPGTCDVCHPKSFDLKPPSHDDTKWASASHGKAALKDRATCLLCHEESFCSDCHGVAMPHPANWAKTHGATAKEKSTACSKCHTPYPDFCSMCHHQGYDTSKGPWLTQHPDTVTQHGAALCFRCHAPTDCIRCHATNGAQIALPGTD